MHQFLVPISQELERNSYLLMQCWIEFFLLGTINSFRFWDKVVNLVWNNIICVIDSAWIAAQLNLIPGDNHPTFPSMTNRGAQLSLTNLDLPTSSTTPDLTAVAGLNPDRRI